MYKSKYLEFINPPKIALKIQPKLVQPQFPWKAPSDGGGYASQRACNGCSVSSTLLTLTDFVKEKGKGMIEL